MKKLKSLGNMLKDSWYYIQGNIRYYLYYKHPRFIRSHIKEQIKYRINSMDRECYNNGSCKLCGCRTTALQMCNKACDKPCYPKMLNKRKWVTLKVAAELDVIHSNIPGWKICLKHKKFIKCGIGKKHT